MGSLSSDIEFCQYLIKYGQSQNSDFKKIYPLCNENINACLDNFNIEGKNCLSVFSSSDQIFDMYLRGARSVYAFDVNPLTKHFFYLKRSLLSSNISYEDYLSFLYGDNKFKESMLNQKIYNNLNGKSRIFWLYIFSKYHEETIREKMFYYPAIKKDEINKYIGYLNKDKFYKLKKNIKNVKITFINSEIKNLTYKLEKNYDFIYLSNIFEYLNEIYFSIDNQIEKLEAFKNLIINMSKNLNENGKIVVGYLFTILLNDNRNPIKNTELRNKVFSEKEFEYHIFNSVDHDIIYKKYGLTEYKSDACIVYKKKKN